MVENIKKELVISAFAGAAIALSVNALICTLRRGKCPKSVPQAPACTTVPGIELMKSDKLPKAVGPYCSGRIVRLADNSRLAYTSGFIG